MKVIAQVFLYVVLCSFANGQNPSTTLGVIMPEASEGFSQAQINQLESKIVQIINNSNDVSVGYTNDFVVYPMISIEESSRVEGGMENIIVTTIDFSLFIKQASTKITYNTISKKIKGSGSNKIQSISNAISQIKTTDDAYKQFILKGEEKITKYYLDNCKTMLQTADNLSTKHDYEQAIGILQSIPASSNNCYNDAQKMSLVVYKKYQSILCSQNLTKAKASIAINNYSEALEALEIIDPSSSCYSEVEKLIAQISSKVDRKEKQEVELEKQRIDAIKEIGKAYYSNSIKLVKYDVLVH